MRIILLSIFVPLLAGCVSVGILPQNASEIDFHSKVEGKTGWSQYEATHTFKDHSIGAVYEASRAGLAHAGFAVVRFDPENGVVFGEHGITPFDWNVVAGVYLKEQTQEVVVKLIVEGSKDIGFLGDATGDDWTARIIEGMCIYLRRLPRSNTDKIVTIPGQ